MTSLPLLKYMLAKLSVPPLSRAGFIVKSATVIAPPDTDTVLTDSMYPSDLARIDQVPSGRFILNAPEALEAAVTLLPSTEIEAVIGNPVLLSLTVPETCPSVGVDRLSRKSTGTDSLSGITRVAEEGM